MPRDNPCKYRYAGCAGDVPDGGRCCESCRAEHSRRERARRDAHRRAGRCIKCGKPVAKTKLVPTGGEPGKLRRVRQAAACCADCLSYFADRAEETRKEAEL
jgi:hypothetical protein